MTEFKPMLAGTVDDLSKVKYPVIVMPKYDGIRCLIVDGKAVTRNLKPIPNKHVKSLIETLKYPFDGEIVCEGGFSNTQSCIMSEEGKPEFKYYVFDIVDKNLGYEDRHAFILRCNTPPFTQLVRTYYAKSQTQLESIYDKFLIEGFEGAVLRNPNSPYKYGRSTINEGYFLKIKPGQDSEAKIIGFIERDNHPNTLGSLIVEDIKTNKQFNIGTGFDEKGRCSLWKNKEKYLDKIVCYRYQKVGAKDLPRFPAFKGFRYD